MDVIAQVVLATLRVHPSRSIGQAELATLAGCTNRQVRTAVNHLRRQGWLIVGDSNGYHFARDIEEERKFLKRISDQIHHLEDLQAAFYQTMRLRSYAQETPQRGVCTGGSG